MTNLFPGAIWKPIPAPGRPKRSKGRAVIFHVAVSEGSSLFSIFSASGNDSHLYVRKDGTLEQYIDLDLVAYASMAANSSTISVETQGGVTNPDAEPWTAAQVATLARIARWAHDTEGVPLQLMPNSLSASKGIGFHRLGIDPWRVSGGEVWSSSRGKVCPGAAKIAQVPGILAAAVAGGSAPAPIPSQEDDMPQLIVNPPGSGQQVEAVHIIPPGHTKLYIACDFEQQKVRLAVDQGANPKGGRVWAWWPGAAGMEIPVVAGQVSFMPLPAQATMVSLTHLGPVDAKGTGRPVTLTTAP